MTTGAERGMEREAFNPNFYTVEIGPGQVPVTIIGRERIDGEALTPLVLDAVRPTAFGLPLEVAGGATETLNGIMREPTSFIGSAVDTAYKEGRPVYMTHFFLPEKLIDIDPSHFKVGSLWPPVFASIASTLLLGHALTPKTKMHRRDFLKGGALAAAGLGVAFATLQPTFPRVPALARITEELAAYTPDQQNLWTEWIMTLSAFSNLVTARKLHHMAHLHSVPAGERILSLSSAEDYGLRAALLLSPEERDALIIDFVTKVIEPLGREGVITIDEFNEMTTSILYLHGAMPVQDSDKPVWASTMYEINAPQGTPA